mmetsp:Transcript_16322/g.37265  ORF Transcript_16322/g.37265 Transcript_16322/m.37265 type:complete len:81 (+) Transcript_16322:332-574(+)
MRQKQRQRNGYGKEELELRRCSKELDEGLNCSPSSSQQNRSRCSHGTGRLGEGAEPRLPAGHREELRGMSLRGEKLCATC